MAREAVAATVHGSRYDAPSLDGWDQPHGVFVTLTSPDGALRGCIGHVRPVHPHLAAEVADVAAAAACSDPRFPPVAEEELGALSLSISVLTPPEPVAGSQALDPRRYGVVVSDGRRRGVLLPDLEGVDTVEDQLRIACRKAGIRWGDPIRLERFEVLKVE